jgi:hypothetical protein
MVIVVAQVGMRLYLSLHILPWLIIIRVDCGWIKGSTYFIDMSHHGTNYYCLPREGGNRS